MKQHFLLSFLRQQTTIFVEQRLLSFAAPAADNLATELDQNEEDTDSDDVVERLDVLRERIDATKLVKIEFAVKKGLDALWPTLKQNTQTALDQNKPLNADTLQMMRVSNNEKLAQVAWTGDATLFGEVAKLFRSIVFGRIEDMAFESRKDPQKATNAANILIQIMATEARPNESVSQSLFRAMVQVRSLEDEFLSPDLRRIFGKTNKSQREALAAEMDSHPETLTLRQTYTLQQGQNQKEYKWTNARILIGGTMSVVAPAFLTSGVFQVKNIVLKDGPNGEKFMIARMANGCKCNLFIARLTPLQGGAQQQQAPEGRQILRPTELNFTFPRTVNEPIGFTSQGAIPQGLTLGVAMLNTRTNQWARIRTKGQTSLTVQQLSQSGYVTDQGNIQYRTWLENGHGGISEILARTINVPPALFAMLAPEKAETVAEFRKPTVSTPHSEKGRMTILWQDPCPMPGNIIIEIFNYKNEQWMPVAVLPETQRSFSPAWNLKRIFDEGYIRNDGHFAFRFRVKSKEPKKPDFLKTFDSTIALADKPTLPKPLAPEPTPTSPPKAPRSQPEPPPPAPKEQEGTADTTAMKLAQEFNRVPRKFDFAEKGTVVLTLATNSDHNFKILCNGKELTENEKPILILSSSATTVAGLEDILKTNFTLHRRIKNALP